ncbi:MAG: AmmeMemoRadiSam system protein B [Pseudomonadota bacterium]
MNSNDECLPRLRNVEPMPVVVGGTEAIALKDPLGLADEVICLRRESLSLLFFLDGLHSVIDVQAELMRRTGRLVMSSDILALVDRLDGACLLESDHFRERYAEKVREFRSRPFRPAAHSGLSYSGDPTDLRADLNSFFTASDGPGLPVFSNGSQRPVGLIAPHIDIRSGGRCFAHAYQALGSAPASDIYVIFGTGHAGVENLFTASYLDFDTPLGLVQTDKDFVRELSDRLGTDAAEEEILHEKEHVIEFQALFLQLVFGGRTPFKIVPILVAVSPYFFTDHPQMRDKRDKFDRFCEALTATCRASSGSICFIASADLDHVGPRYGDSFTPDPAMISRSLARDKQTIGYLERLETDAFMHDVAVDNDTRRICGFSPIMAMMNCMEATEGRLLDLDFAYVDNRNSFVSFASVVFY